MAFGLTIYLYSRNTYVQPTKSELRLAMRKFPEAHEAFNTGVQEKWDPANMLAWQGQSQQ